MSKRDTICNFENRQRYRKYLNNQYRNFHKFRKDYKVYYGKWAKQVTFMDLLEYLIVNKPELFSNGRIPMPYILFENTFQVSFDDIVLHDYSTVNSWLHMQHLIRNLTIENHDSKPTKESINNGNRLDFFKRKEQVSIDDTIHQLQNLSLSKSSSSSATSSRSNSRMDIDLDDISNKLTFLSLSKESQDKLKNQIPEPIEYFNPKTKAKIICVPQNSHPVKNYNLQAFKVESKLSRCGIKASFNEKTFLDTGFYGNEVMESRKIPEKLNLKPHSHQVEGFTWLVHTELTHRGGIIADDPGLGKTLQIFMLYLHNKRIENCAGTLIVVPASLMNQWKQEIERYYDGKLQIILHHGQSRHTVPLQSYEIVITTYSSKKNVNTALTSDYNKYPDALYKRNWTRIVLDEAHEIANSETQKAKACFAITALYRWCVTGTPLQNSLMDVYSLFKFMNNNKYTNLSTYKDHFGMKNNISDQFDRIEKIRDVFGMLLLRRTKAVINNQLPPPKREVKTLDLSEDEKVYIDLVRSELYSIYGEVSSSSIGGTALLALLGYAKMLCNHFQILVNLENEDEKSKKQLLRNEIILKTLTCRYCKQAFKPDLSRSNCNICLKQKIDVKRFYRDLNLDLPRHSALISTKIDAAVKLILENIKKGNKTVVFSQYTTTLCTLVEVLKIAGVECFQYDGKLSPAEKNLRLSRFAKNENLWVMCASIKAANVGLNITCANEVIFLDLWWNPFAEDQAISRVHRIGQTKIVNVVKLISNTRVEEKILDIQTKKRFLGEAILQKPDPKLNQSDAKEVLKVFFD